MIAASPALVASEVIYFMPGVPLMAFSIGMSTDSVRTFALAPGYAIFTTTTGGAMSGNWEMGKKLMANIPISTIKMDMTMANTGRFMKFSNICYVLNVLYLLFTGQGQYIDDLLRLLVSKFYFITVLNLADAFQQYFLVTV